ncbi:MAG: CoA-binding protein [Firmicutes bacterium]|nr:CoA-binding protein [Alicyclobacillaceae bacterium]MCL6498271.1 CoA-binding protein [Bacillota bacterium]
MGFEEIVTTILEQAKVIAVVGLSDRPDRPSYGVAQFLQAHGCRIIPVNPQVTSVLGEVAYPSLGAIPREVTVDVVDVFRRADQTPAVAAEAVAIGAKALWLQLGIVSPEAATIASAGGLTVVMDRCMKIEWEQRWGSGPQPSEPAPSQAG